MSEEKWRQYPSKNLKMKIFANDIFKFHVHSSERIPKQGWKIHVSASYDNVIQIYKQVKTFCYRYAINFKNVKTKRIYLNNFLSRGADRKNAAKFITIYPINASHAKEILKKLYPKLKKFNGPEILTDKQYKKSILHYRYGNNQQISFQQAKEEKLYFDTRAINKHKPSTIKDLFPTAQKTKQELKIGEFYVKNVLHFSNYGGTYLVEKDGKAYVAKEGRPYLGISKFDNPHNLRLRETKITSYLRGAKIVPNYYTTIKLNGYVYAIFEYIEGLSLSKLALQNFAVLFWKYLPEETRKENERLLMRVIDSCMEFLKKASEYELSINDIKADNFIWNTQSVICIDLDTASIKRKTENVKVYHPISFLNKKTGKVVEVMKMGYMLASMISNFLSLKNLKWSSTKIINFFWDFCIWYKVPPQIRDNIVSLMNFGNKDSLNNKVVKPKKINKSLSQPQLSDTCSLLSELRGTAWINKIFENKIWDSEKNGYYWKSVYLDINSQKLKESLEGIENIYNSYVKDTVGVKYLCTPGLHCSSYIFLGNAGLVVLMLFFKRTFNSNYFDKKLCTLLDAMEPRYILKPNFLTGIVGIAYVALAMYTESNDQRYLSIIQNHLVTLKYFRLKNRSNASYKDSYGKTLSLEETEKILRLLECFSHHHTNSLQNEEE